MKNKIYIDKYTQDYKIGDLIRFTGLETVLILGSSEDSTDCSFCPVEEIGQTALIIDIEEAITHRKKETVGAIILYCLGKYMELPYRKDKPELLVLDLKKKELSCVLTTSLH
tara:strand:- start:2194 stop:2529 length:336 start_codon:yes stop_codon:yes gene_type:complete